MTVLDRILTFIRRDVPKYIQPAKSETDNNVTPKLPTHRQTRDDRDATLFDALPVVTEEDYPTRLIKVIEYLVEYNHDFGFALENIVQLANTPYTVSFDSSVKGDDVKGFKRLIDNSIDTWYQDTSGEMSLRNDMLVRCVIYGCICIDIVPNNTLTGVDQVVLVDPKTIVFKYDDIKERWMPWQNVNGELIELNPITFKYYAVKRKGSKPYPMVPFLTALESFLMEKDMYTNVKSIVKNVSVLGFLEVLLKQPMKNTTNGAIETDEEYKSRLLTDAQQATDELRTGLKDGFVVGYKGQHEFKMNSVASGNVDGVEKLFRLITEAKSSGLKQSPFMLGRNYSTTETLGRVLLAVLASSVSTYQNVMDKALSDIMSLHLMLSKGYKGRVTVKSQKPLISDELKDQQVFLTKIQAYDLLYQQGVVSQEQRAQALGFEEPFKAEPLQPSTIPTLSDTVTNTAIKKISHFEKKFAGSIPEYDYKGGLHHKETEGFVKDKDKLRGKYTRLYTSATKGNYKKAIEVCLGKIEKVLSSIPKTASVEDIVTSLTLSVLTNWETAFTDEQKAVINRYVSRAYKEFRKDISVFKGATDAVPEAVFDLNDIRTVEYMKTLDEVYLGKFITDKDVKKSVTDFVRSAYLEEGFDLGDSAVRDRFKKQFGAVLLNKEWKIDLIIRTTVSRMRFQAGVNYMQQAGVDKFIRLAINDRLTCEYCSNLNGRKFFVSKSYETTLKTVNGGVESLKIMSPFVTTIYKDFNDMKNLSDAQIQDSGAEIVPSHGNCRCSIYADL